jgi:transmembrane sensor
MNKSHFIELLEQYLAGSISPEDKLHLKELLDQPVYLKKLESRMEESFNSEEFVGEENPRIREQVQKYLQEKIAGTTSPVKQPSKLIYFSRIAAASVLIIGLTYWFFYLSHPAKRWEAAQINKPADVASPKSSTAMITLADGSRIALDSLGNGIIASQKNVKVIKLSDGQIAYEGNSSEIIYNTLYNPKGSKVVMLTLADGTKVWLNNESSVRYPVAFVGRERKVEITGEAYFEVFHDLLKPFQVTVNGVNIEVFGTHFNINSYTEQELIKATLLEGSIKVSKNGNTKFIKPGEQAKLYPDGRIDINNSMDLEEVMAWKNGYFYFNGASTEDIMQQVIRWYDVDVEYQGNVKNERFAGSLPRFANVSELLNLLELTKTVKFSIEDRKIIVKPNN